MSTLGANQNILVNLAWSRVIGSRNLRKAMTRLLLGTLDGPKN